MSTYPTVLIAVDVLAMTGVAIGTLWGARRNR